MVDSISLPQKATARRRDWTKGPILKNLLLLSWPMIVMEAAYMISQIFDMIWVGRTGSAAIAAIGISGLLVGLLSIVDIAIISGARAMIARFMGAGDHESARKVAAQAYLLAICWGTLVTLFGFFLAGPMFSAFGVEPAVVSEGMIYLRVLFTGWLSLEMHVMGLYIIQSTGDSMKPMITQLIVRSLHVILCPFLVLGLWIFPHLGISGAAYSNVISQSLGGILGLYFIFGGHTRLKLGRQDIRFRPDIIIRLLKIGVPSLFSIAQSMLSNLVLARIVVPFGTLAVAAHSITNNVQAFVITPNIGMGSAVAVLVGQNLGARQPERAVKSTWLGVAILEGFLITCGIVVMVMAERIVGVFNSDPALIEIGATFLRIATAAYIVMGLNSALTSCISGAGDTLPTMIINVGMIWAVQIPLAFILSNYTAMDANGIRWAIVVSTFVAVMATFTYFRSGRWKTKRV